ncbi:hypothetical protein THAOC_18901 [Thalassiosira oceanica]|uniref:Uncharacterized protein n=1 Tax=Thalassiosira oceanica TaxID=159749 RepID=K0S745_THAOC|nr:hypothetical protein THAOC_18901 [Thalassiosira oceanica]|eukprot:EJK60699.1 hypothetical protein THAOC_18901 [Thalassiosira oceanica]
MGVDSQSAALGTALTTPHDDFWPQTTSSRIHKPRACRVCPRLRCVALQNAGKRRNTCIMSRQPHRLSFRIEKNKTESPRCQTAPICLGEPRSFFKGLMIVVCDLGRRLFKLDLDSGPISLATSPASKLLVRSRSRPPAAFECPDRFLKTSRPILDPSIASCECPFTGGFVSRVVRPSKADALEMKPSSQPAERPPASRIVSDRLGDLDHWSTTDRHALSYTPALDARLPAYPLPHRPVPPARSPLSGIERL